MTVTNFNNYGTMNQVEAGATQINNYYGVHKTAAAAVSDELPQELSTEAAEGVWANLREGGFIVAGGYALAEGVSNNQAAYIADRMAARLDIKHKWKVFQQLWGLTNLAQLAGTWQQTGKLPPQAKEIDRLME